MVAAKTATVVPAMIPSVPVVAVLPKAFPSAAQVAYGPVVQAMPKNVPVETIAQVTKGAVMTPLKKAVAAVCATAVAGMGYVGSLFAHTPPVVAPPVVAPLVPAPTVFQAALNSISQHKMVATGVAVATLTTAYCVRYKINPVTKMKKYFGSPKDPLVIIYER